MPKKMIFPHTLTINRTDRSTIKGHKPLVLWFTGLSGSGKSTIANELEYQLVHRQNAHTYLLDGDNLRTGLNAGLGFSPGDRVENIRRAGEVAKLMFDAGLIVIASFISPYRADREIVRKKIPAGYFLEIYVSCPLETCIERDTKGLYHKALAGEITEFTGVSSPYEPPGSPELVLESDKLNIGECVSMIIDYLEKKEVFGKTPPKN